jgi:hypothetical protein
VLVLVNGFGQSGLRQKPADFGRGDARFKAAPENACLDNPAESRINEGEKSNVVVTSAYRPPKCFLISQDSLGMIQRGGVPPAATWSPRGVSKQVIL